MSSAENTEGNDQSRDGAGSFYTGIFCDICEEDTRSHAVFKCATCEENFCEKCSVFHTRQKISRDHRLDEIRDTDRTLITCVNHDSAAAEFYCRECVSQICEECSTQNHDGHNVEHLDTLAEYIRNKLDTDLRDMDLSLRAELLQVEHVTKKGLVTRTSVEEQRQTEIAKIYKRRDELQNDIENLCKELCEKMYSQSEESLTAIGQKMERLQNRAGLIRSVLHKREYLRTCPNSLTVAHEGGELLREFQELVNAKVEEIIPKKTSLVEFQHSVEISAELLENLFGKITVSGSVKTISVNPKSNFQMKNQDPGDITNVFPPGGDTYWISRKNSINLELYDTKGSYHHTKVWPNEPIGITDGIDGCLLIIMKNSTGVYSLSPDGNRGEWCGTCELYPTDLHFQKDTEVLYVCGNTRQSRKYGNGDKDGILRSKRGGKSLTRLDDAMYDLGSLERITANSSGNVCVTDAHNKRVIIYTSDGKDSYFYSGIHSETEESTFAKWFPLDVSTARSNCFIVLCAVCESPLKETEDPSSVPTKKHQSEMILVGASSTPQTTATTRTAKSSFGNINVTTDPRKSTETVTFPFETKPKTNTLDQLSPTFAEATKTPTTNFTWATTFTTTTPTSTFTTTTPTTTFTTTTKSTKTKPKTTTTNLFFSTSGETTKTPTTTFTTTTSTMSFATTILTTDFTTTPKTSFATTPIKAFPKPSNPDLCLYILSEDATLLKIVKLGRNIPNGIPASISVKDTEMVIAFQQRVYLYKTHEIE